MNDEKKYLVIFEDGSMKIFKTILPEILDGLSEGILDIIDMQNCTELVAFPDNWVAIDEDER